MAPAGHPLLGRCVKAYVAAYSKGKPYSYWDWSIVHVINDKAVFTDRTLWKKKSGVYRIGNQSYQLLSEHCEGRRTDFHGYYCAYKRVRVLNNRHKHYDPELHDFAKNHVTVRANGIP